VELYKGNIPAQYGGHLASVLDVEMRDGNFEQFAFKGGIGPIAGCLSVEGPLIKDKSSFIAGGRLSYSDWFLDLVKIPEVNRSSSFFYDLNLLYCASHSCGSPSLAATLASHDEEPMNNPG
jgi:hypothetical protein